MLTKSELSKLINQTSYVNTLKAKHPGLIADLNQAYPNRRVAEQVYLYINNLTNPPCCVVCSKESRFKNVKAGYSKYCGSEQCYHAHRKILAAPDQPNEPPNCINCDLPVIKNKNGKWSQYCSKKCRGQYNSKKSRDKAKKVWLEKYGVDHPRKSKEINQKLKNQWLEKYGVDNPAKAQEVQEKMRRTCELRYGKSNPGHLSKFHQNENLEQLRSADQLKELYPKHDPYAIADMLGVHVYTVYRYLHQHELLEPYKSSFEKQLCDYLDELEVQYRENDRTILGGRELDIVIPDQKLAIECHGVFWHHDQHERIDRNYHQRKFLDCEKKGYQLISIFDDVWYGQQEIVKSMLKSKLGLADKKVYARQCQVAEVPSANLQDFLNQNHIQGFTGAQVALALQYQGEIVACMTFSKPRMGIGRHKSNTVGVYELVRYATSQQVVGGASKLLSAFVKKYSPEKVYSYSDNEWSDGNLYHRLGFSLIKDQRPGYWYIAPGNIQRLHRFRFAKYRLIKEGYDPNKTEYEIMLERGYTRIWDCGKRVWVLER